MCSGVSLTSSGGTSLALVGHSSIDGITIKICYVEDVLLHWQALTLSFAIGLVKIKSDSTVRSVDTYLGR